MPNYHIYDNFRWSWRINGDFDWLVLHHLGQSVDNDENQVIGVALSVRRQWQAGHEVLEEVLPLMYRYRQGL